MQMLAGDGPDYSVPQVSLAVYESTSIGFQVRIGRFAFSLTTMGPAAEYETLLAALSNYSAADLEHVFDAQIEPEYIGEQLVGYEISPMRSCLTQDGKPTDSFSVRLSLTEWFVIVYQMLQLASHRKPDRDDVWGAVETPVDH
jgi:hypothetical protein